MNYYGGKELAAAFRTVRKNTIQIAEDVPEESSTASSRRPNRGSIGQTLAHIAVGTTFPTMLHGERIPDREDRLRGVHEEGRRRGSEAAGPRPRLSRCSRTRASKFAAMLESLDESFLAEVAHVPPRRGAAVADAFRHAARGERTRNAPSRPADADGADDRHRAAPDASAAGADGALSGASSRNAYARDAPRFSAATLSFLRRLKRNNRREWFNAHRDEYEARRAGADDRRHRAAGRRLPVVCAGSRRQPEAVAVPDSIATSGSPRTRSRTRHTSRPSSRAADLPKHEGAGHVLSCLARRRVGGRRACRRRRRRSCTRSASTSPRTAGVSERSSSAPAFRKTVGALEGERLQRVPRGFPKDHEAAEYPEAPAVSRRLRVSGVVRDQPEVLQRPARRLPSNRAARRVSERAAARQKSGAVGQVGQVGRVGWAGKDHG